MFEYIVAAAIIGIFLWKSGLAKNLYNKAMSKSLYGDEYR